LAIETAKRLVARKIIKDLTSNEAVFNPENIHLLSCLQEKTIMKYIKIAQGAKPG